LSHSEANRQHQELSTDELLRKQEYIISKRPPTLRKALLVENEEDASTSAEEASTSNESSSPSQDAQITDEELESIFTITPTERVPLGTKSPKSIATRMEGQAKKSTSSSSSSSSSSFSALGISAPLQAALTAMSIKVPTEVQRACIPPLLAGE
jgi:ATP-dependent RNA helicase DDX49/DBP8